MISVLLSVVLVGCPSERGSVKNLLDPDAVKIQRLAIGIELKVEQLTVLPPPSKWTPTLSRQKTEFERVTILVDVVGAKLEADQDFHVVIEGETGQTMIAEFPARACIANAPPELQLQMNVARRAFLKAFGKLSAKFRTLPKPMKAKITGVIHFDRLHGQTGVAPNGVELHPVLLFEPL